MVLIKGILLFALFNGTIFISAQPFFFKLPSESETFNRRLGRFANNDILIGDSSDDGVFSVSNGKIFLTRIDHCGNIVWSNSYERRSEYLEFKDVVLNQNDDIFAYGSAYRGGQEMLFLLKVASNGRLINFRLIQTGTIDHFSYDLDIKNGLLLLYGLLLDFNTQKEGFISIFDEGLNHLWGKRFAPFESEGEAIIDSRNQFVCRSGPFHYVLDKNGDLVWSAEVDLKAGALPIAGPIEIAGGYVYESYRDQSIFFYKLDYDGNLIWKSDKIPSVKFPADLSTREDGTLVASYKQTYDGENVLVNLVLNAATGQILNHNYLNIGQSIDFEHVYHDLDLKGNLRVIGNKVLLEKYPIDIPYFLMQFPLDGSSNTCFSWEPLSIASSNDIPLVLNQIDTVILDTRMTALATDGATQVVPYEYHIEDICDYKREPEVILQDTILSCEEGWHITLPGDQFKWDDGFTKSERLLQVTGSYRASNQDCLTPMVYEYYLSKPECLCQVYLPNAISANGDNLNDMFEIYSDCQIVEFTLSVFNRWGMKVFEEKNQGWDGRSADGFFEPGIYLIKVQYRLQDNGGIMQEGKTIQEAVLLR